MQGPGLAVHPIRLLVSLTMVRTSRFALWRGCTNSALWTRLRVHTHFEYPTNISSLKRALDKVYHGITVVALVIKRARRHLQAMADDRLIAGHQTPTFSSSGTVVWNNVAGSVFSCSVEALNRFRQSQVDISTVASALTLFNGFLVIPAAQQRQILEALQQLRCFGIRGKVVYVGFGWRSTFVDLVRTEAGMSCVALCASLTNSHDTFFAAQVLRELWSLRAPDSPCPAIHQWQSFVNLAARTLEATKFPILVEKFATLMNSRPFSNVNNSYPTDARCLAQAVVVLAKS